MMMWSPPSSHCRYLTMQVFLSSVEEGGESTFPVADNRTYDEQVCACVCAFVCLCVRVSVCLCAPSYLTAALQSD